MNDGSTELGPPAHIDLLRAFVNTRDVDTGTEALLDTAALQLWLDEHGLLSSDAGGAVGAGAVGAGVAGATEADLERAYALREGLRAVLIGHHDGHGGGPGASNAEEPGASNAEEPGASNAERLSAPHAEQLSGAHAGGLDDASAALPLRMSFGTGNPVLVPTGDGVAAALARILVAVDEAKADGTWDRLKVCEEDTCQYAFYDESRNHSRQWCAMRVCGNRKKTRTYRARQRTTTQEPAAD